MGDRNPVALVTDWRGTAGVATCYTLAQAGFSLLVNAQPEDIFDLQGLDCAGKILAVPFDVVNEKDVSEKMGVCLNQLGGIDIMVNNPYFWNDAALDDITEEMWSEVLNNGLKATFYCSRMVSKIMRAQQYGKIINVISTSAYTGVNTQYAAACAAIHSLTRSLARDLARDNIRVNTIACGLIDEPWIDEGGPEFREMLTADIPLKRLCTVQDVAEAVNYLACGADFMTGQMLVLDGGETMR